MVLAAGIENGFGPGLLERVEGLRLGQIIVALHLLHALSTGHQHGALHDACRQTRAHCRFGDRIECLDHHRNRGLRFLVVEQPQHAQTRRPSDDSRRVAQLLLQGRVQWEHHLIR